MKKHPLSGLLICFVVSNAFVAQSGIVVTGGDATSASGSASSSVGQIDYQYSESVGGSITSGIQQSYEVAVSEIDESQKLVGITVYPNPTSDFINVEIEEQPEGYVLDLYDHLGKLIDHRIVNDSKTTIPLEKLSDAYYLLELKKDNVKLKTYKIVKL